MRFTSSSAKRAVVNKKVAEHTFQDFNLDDVDYSPEEPRSLLDGKLPACSLVDSDKLKMERNSSKEEKDVRQNSVKEICPLRPQVDWEEAPSIRTQSAPSSTTTGMSLNGILITTFLLNVTGPSKKTQRGNKRKKEKRKAGVPLGPNAMAKKRFENEMRGIIKGVEVHTHVNTSDDLKHTGPAFKGMNMSKKEALEIEKLQDFHYIPSTPG